MDRGPGLLSPDRTIFDEGRPGERQNSDTPTPNVPLSAYERPYDPPDIHPDDGDIAMHQMDEPQSGETASPIFPKGDYSYQPAGSTFESDTKSLLTKAKRYDHRESRKFLFQTGAYRFLVTLGFSILIGISLKAYEGFKVPFIMDKTQVRVFNALMLGLSLGLGLNLASSLKRYAVILRWYLLTRRYVSLEVFDLILGLETLTKVGKLMVISLPGVGPNGKLRFLRKSPWFREGRDDGTRFTWIACLLWILLNIAAQVLVAALSLFWPVDPSNLPLQTWGNVTVANLTTWSDTIPSKGRWANSTSMEAAWMHGMEAIVYPTTELNGQEVGTVDLSTLPGTPLYRGDGYHEYNFYNRDPDRQFTNYVMSSRSVRARATCRQIETRGSVQKQDGDELVIDYKDEKQNWQKYILMSRTNGSLTYIASTYESCGPRCTNITVFQDQDSSNIKAPSLFFCNSYFDEIKGTSSEFVNLSPTDKEALYSNNDFARIAAGSIAWTGGRVGGWYTQQSRYYLGGSKWSPYEMVGQSDVEELIARFTVGAVAAFDDHGLRYNLTNQPCRPIQGQSLQVDWPYVLGLLGGICLIQFAALILLLAWGNKSVIRDESFFSLAMLLSPVVNRIGKQGMNLSGEEIKQDPKLLWKRIKYDYTEGKNGEPNKVDVVFLGRGDYESRRSWAPGVYT